MDIPIPITILQKLMEEAAERGASKALAKAGNIKPYMNKSEAYRLYGRANVDSWIRKGALTQHKDGGKSAMIRIDRLQIEQVAARDNRHIIKPRR